MSFLIKKSDSASWGIYLGIFLLIYTSKDSCFFGVNINNNIKLIGYALTLLTSIYLINKAGFVKTIKTSQPFILVLSILSICTLFLNYDFSIKYFYVILLFISCSAIVNLVSFDSFKSIYLDILVVLSISSIVIHFINIAAPGLLSIFPMHENEGGYPFRFCVLGVASTPEYGDFRNWGIFREPGVFVFYLCLGLIFELFSKKINFGRVVCYIITITTTLSTAGFVIAGCIFIVFLFCSKQATAKQRFLFFLLLVVGFAYLLLSGMANDIIEVVFGKLLYENDSTASRAGSVATNLNIWLDNFISVFWGHGYTFVEQNFSNFQDMRIGGENNTNTALKMLAVYGFFFTCILYGLTFKSCMKHFKSVGFIIFFLIILLQSNEDLIVSFYTYLLAFYAFDGRVTRYT